MKLRGRGELFHPTLNIRNYLERISNETKGKIILNLGSGDSRPIPHAINVDILRGNEVDIIADVHHLPFKNECADGVVLITVLEHVKNPSEVILETWRVLSNAGLIYCEIPFLEPFHAAPRDYWRTTKDGIEELFKDFKRIDSGVCIGPGSTVTWILMEYPRALFGDNFFSACSFMFLTFLRQ